MEKNEPARRECFRFFEYLYRIRWYLVVFAVLYAAVYGPWVNNIYPRVDTEEMLNVPHSTYAWMEVGRQGMVLTKWISGLDWYNPFAEYFLGYTALFVSCVLFGFLFWRTGGGKLAAFGVMLLALISPIMAEQLYFELQLFEIGLAYCLCAMAAAAAYYGLWHRNLLYEGISVGLMIWVFSSYQILIILYVAVVVTSFILLYINWTIAGNRCVDSAVYLRLAAGHIVLFTIALVLNTGITKLFFTSAFGSSYLSGYFAWGEADFTTLLKNIVWNIFSSLTGKEKYYTPFYGLAACGAVAMTIVSAAEKKDAPLRWLWVLAETGLQILPFGMTIVFGAPPSVRVQIVYPFVLASNFIILVRLGETFHFRKAICGGVAVCTVICLWSQCLITQRLVYTDVIRGQEDLRLAAAVEQRIEEVSECSKPIAFVGAYENQLNAACTRGEYIGKSIFAVDYTVEPHYFFSSNRICNLLRMVGFPFTSVTQAQMLAARETALEMPVWPEKGSVVDAGDFTIVKLSEDHWDYEVADVP